MNIEQYWTAADRREVARKQWNAECVLRQYPAISPPRWRPGVEVDAIIAQIRAVNATGEWAS